MQKSIVSQNMANPSMYPFPNSVQYLLSWFTLLGTSLLVTLLSQLIFSIVLHIHISQQSTEGKSVRKSKEHPWKTVKVHQESPTLLFIHGCVRVFIKGLIKGIVRDLWTVSVTVDYLQDASCDSTCMVNKWKHWHFPMSLSGIYRVPCWEKGNWCKVVVSGCPSCRHPAGITRRTSSFL